MSTLTDRYVHAATRFVQDADERRELGLDLRERIADTVETLQAGGTAEADLERAALTELGDPLRVAATYRQQTMHLIGPRYFYMWLRVVVIGLATAAPITAVISALAAFSEGQAVGAVIGGAIGQALSVAVHVCFWVTLFFAAAERFSPLMPAAEVWTPDLLPELPQGDRANRRTDLVASVTALALTAGLVLWQAIGSPFLDADGDRVPVLNPEWAIAWVPVLLLLLVLEGVHAVAVYRSGWTWPTAIGNAVLAIAFTVPVVWLLSERLLLNPAFLDLFGGVDWLRTATPIAMVSVVVLAVWDVALGVVRTLKQSGRPA